MCLALPAEVVALDGDTATVNLDGVEAPVSLAFLEGVGVGDFVVVHVGYALSRVDPEIASEQIAAMKGDAAADVAAAYGES
ncbi:MAG: HypC/HybG/HupF family hydrogenase formation chaperone [Pseudomonadota bacterium]